MIVVSALSTLASVDWQKNLRLHKKLQEGFMEIENNSTQLIALVDLVTDEELKFETGAEGAGGIETEIDLF
jgi:hypothetical protein